MAKRKKGETTLVRVDARGERHFEIEDARGRRMTTLTAFRADQDARALMAAAIMDAVRRGDLEGCARAQAAMREAFPV